MFADIEFISKEVIGEQPDDEEVPKSKKPVPIIQGLMNDLIFINRANLKRVYEAAVGLKENF